MGDPSAEVTDDDRDAAQPAKQEAMELMSNGDFAAAIEKFTTVIKLAPTALAYANRAVCFATSLKPNAAIRDCNAALALNMDSAKALKTRGKAYRMLGEWDLAHADLAAGQIIDFDPETDEVQRFVATKVKAENDKRKKRLAKDLKWREQKAAKAGGGGGFGGPGAAFPGMGGMGGMPGPHARAPSAPARRVPRPGAPLTVPVHDATRAPRMTLCRLAAGHDARHVAEAHERPGAPRSHAAAQDYGGLCRHPAGPEQLDEVHERPGGHGPRHEAAGARDARHVSRLRGEQGVGFRPTRRRHYPHTPSILT
jgi:hypothetical protein